jgi:DNA-directed RNA polymerase specialized sigma24 family protein/anti-sigma factor RsiW
VRNIFPLGSSGLGDAELVSAARTGDADAYAELTTRHLDSARRLAGQLVSADRVDGLVEEAFAKVLLVLKRGDGPDLAFRPYLLTAVRRLHVDHKPAAATAEAPETPEDAAAARAFSSLPEPWRMVLWHTEVEGESPAQVAALLGEQPESVPALVTRAREGMRIALITRHDQVTDKECEWTRHNLGAFVRQVSFDRDTARVERHLGTCERCAAICAELTEGNTDIRGVLAPLVLGSAAAAYLAGSRNSAAAARPVVGVRARRRRGAAVVGGVSAVVAGAVGGFRGAAPATAAAPARVTGSVGDRLGRAKDFVTDRSAATAVAGVAAIAVVAGGIFVVGQTMDGPLEASAEAPLGVVLDDTTSAPTDDANGDPLDRLGDPASTELSQDASDDPSSSESASDDPSDGLSDDPSDPSDPTDPSNGPTGPTGPGRPGDNDPTKPPGHEPSHEPSHPTQPPTQQPSNPTQPPTQEPTQPTQPPTQAPTPPTDMSVSASSSDLLGLLWGIDVRVSGLTPGGSATLVVRSSGGGSTGLTMDGRCSRVSGGGASCRVSNTPASYHFNAQALVGRSNTLTFTVYPDGDSDANTGDNSTSVTIRP